MKCLVTGCAGFIGSHLTDRLLLDGHEVIGIDCFTDYYSRVQKEHHVQSARKSPSFKLIEKQISECDLASLLDGVAIIFHQAAQAGVRASWGRSFEIYSRLNIEATQLLLEAAKNHKSIRFVYASSSSVYGDAEKLPTRESDLPQPYSPYGVSKLAGEHLCQLYYRNYGLQAVSLRYFTVYGPRQRPDMAFHKFLLSFMNDTELPLFGDGEQTRDFTFIDDAIDANIAAGFSDKAAGGVFNIGGGSRVSVNQVLEIMEQITGKKKKIRYEGRQHGDVRHTGADISKAAMIFGYAPKIRLDMGLSDQYKWIRSYYGG